MPGKSNLEKEQEARTNRKMSIKVLDSIIKKRKKGGKGKSWTVLPQDAEWKIHWTVVNCMATQLVGPGLGMWTLGRKNYSI